MPKRPAPWHAFEALEQRTLLATVTWDGGGGDFSWHNPLNWSTDALPGPGDDVVINVAGTPTITHSQNVTTEVRSIRSNEFLAISGGVIRTATEFRAIGPVTMSGGAIGGAGNLVLNAALTWSGGLIGGTGRVQVLASGKIFVTGSVTLSRLVVNNGAINWTAGDWRFADGSVYNLPGNTINLQSAGSILSLSGTNLITNAGTLARNGTSMTASTINVRTNSTGLVEVRQGRLNITGGGNAVNGVLRAGSGTTLALSGVGFQLATNAVLEGGGVVRVEGGNQWILGTVNSLSRLVLDGAGINYQGAGSVGTFTFDSGLLTSTRTLTVTTLMSWSAGSVAGTGTLIIGPNATLNSSGGATKGLSGTLDNRGTVTWGAGTLKFTGGTIVNKGTFTADTQRFFSGGGVNLFVNAGQFTKAGGSALTFENSLGGVALNNVASGTTTVQAGALRLFGGGINQGTITGAGQGSLVFDWTAYTIAGGVVTGVPSITILSVVNFSGGVISGEGLLIVAGSGSLTMLGNNTKTLARSVANSGALSWVAGNLVLDLVTVTNGSQGVVNFSSSGTLTAMGGTCLLNNSGILNKTGGAALDLSGQDLRVSNAGTIDVKGGSLVLAGSRLANFDANVLTGGVWTVRSGATFRVQGADLQTNNADVRIHGSGSFFNFSTLRGNGGVLSLSDGAVLAVNPGGNNFVNAGRMEIDATSRLNVTGNFTLGSNSVLQVDMLSAVLFGRVNATLTAALGGEVRARYQYTPTAGATFQFVSAATRLGDFAGTSATGLPSTLKSVVKVLSNGARFEVQNA
jgi:hypothetical protein